LRDAANTYRVPVLINDTITVSLGHRRYGSGNINRCRAHADPSPRAEKRRLHQQEPLSAGQVGEHVVGNVTASISPFQGEPLLGQSFLSKFGAVTLDYKRLVLILSR
jgi:hypothetical protein